MVISPSAMLKSLVKISLFEHWMEYLCRPSARMVLTGLAPWGSPSIDIFNPDGFVSMTISPAGVGAGVPCAGASCAVEIWLDAITRIIISPQTILERMGSLLKKGNPQPDAD